MKTTSNAPIYMKVYNRLKNQILSGSYPSGSFLPTESELEQIYQVSRTVKRLTRQILFVYALAAPFKVLNMILVDS